MISLPLKIRYAAILAVVTAVEWSGKYFIEMANKEIKSRLEKTKKGKSKIIHQLEIMNQLTALERDGTIKNLESLVYVRNCIAHNAGLEEDYKYKSDLSASIERLKGFSLANWHFLGNHIAIEKGALGTYIEEMKHLVLDIQKAAYEQKLLENKTSAS